MKKFFTALSITFILACIFEFIGFWQGMVIAGIAGSLMCNRPSQAFFAAFLGVFLCWFLILLYGEIFHQIFPIMKITTKILMLPENLSWLIFLITMLLGGILGGLGALNGFYWKKIFFTKKQPEPQLIKNG